MPAWPASLPTYVLVDGYSEGEADTLLHTPSDTGPGAVRQRSTAGPIPLTCNIACTAAQVEAVRAFYRTTLKGGSLPFDWTHPITRAACVAMFRPGEQPTRTPEPGGTTFVVNLPLQVMP